MADPLLAKSIIEPLKSQGIAAMGDTAIQVQLKFMAKPGQQFVVRRAIYSKVRQAFKENGITFAATAASALASPAPVAKPEVEIVKMHPGGLPVPPAPLVAKAGAS